MARYLTSSSLIDSVKRRAMIPSTQSTFTDADFLRFALEELDMAVIPHILSYHEDYFLFTEYIDLERNVNRYSIPYRAIGNKLRDVSYVDVGGFKHEMTRASIEDVSFYQADGYSSTNSTIMAFYIENNEIVVFPEKNFTLTGQLAVSYYLRPNELVDEARIMTIIDINRTTGVIEVDNIPNHIKINSLLDIIQVKSPHKCLSIDVPITDIDTTNNLLTFNTSKIPTKLAVGDHIALAEECIIPQIPTDLHSMLAQRIAARCLEALNDQQGLAIANQKISEMELKSGSLIDDRVEGAPLKVVNRRSTLRQGQRRKYRRF